MKNMLLRSTALGILALATAPAHAVDLITGLGGPAGFGANQFDDNDDRSIGVNLGFTVNFFGHSFGAGAGDVFLNNNGNISFGASTGAFTPSPFGNGYNGVPMIAAYWTDIDTRGRGDVYYSSTAERFVATWHDVGYYPSGTDAGNTFQLVLISRNDDPLSVDDDGNFDVEFRYSQLEWPGANGGSGYRPQAGYDVGYLDGDNGYGGGGGGDNGYGDNGYGGGGGDNGYGGGGDGGDGGNEDGNDEGGALSRASSVFSSTEEEPGNGAGQLPFYSLPGSFDESITELVNTSNTGTDGLWKFQFRGGALADGSSPNAPLDPTIFDDGGFQFEFEITQPTQPIFIDPLVAVGYVYEVSDTSPLIRSVWFTGELGDSNGYQIYALSDTAMLNSLGTVFADPLGQSPFVFSGPGVRGFRLGGIDPDIGLDPTDPSVFVTGLTFATAGTVNISQSPITLEVPGVPEPATWAMMILGFGLVGMAARRRRPVTA